MKGSRSRTIILVAALLMLAGAAGDAFAQGVRLQVGAPRGRMFVRTRPPQDDAPLRTPRAVWKSGEILDGDLAGADAQSISIKSDFFAEPVQLRTDALSRIEFPEGGAVPPPGAFTVLLKNGDRLYGAVVATAADGWVLKSDRHGELKIPLGSVQSVRRLKGGPVLYAGPQGSLGWRHYGLRDVQGFPWSVGPHGTLTTRTWNRAAQLDVEMPEKVEVDLVVSSTGPLRFGLCLVQAQNSGQVMAVETWQDDLVIAHANRFTPLLRLQDDQHSLGLRVVWDRNANLVRVHDWSGALMGEFTTDPMNGLKPCVVIRNKGSNLTLEQLEVRTWDGGALAARDVRQGYVEDMSGVRTAGVVTAGADGRSLIVAGTSVPLDQLLAFDAGPVDAAQVDARFRPLAALSITADPAARPLSQAIFADGTQLSGSLVSMDQSIGLKLRHTMFADPVAMRAPGMKRLLLREPDAPGASDANTPLDELDELHLTGTVLHGRLEGTGDDRLRWRLPGAMGPVAVAKRTDIEVHRPSRPDKPVPPAPALFFLKDGNVLGGDLRSVTKESIAFQSSIAETGVLDPTELSAIHFNTQRINTTGFGDSGWMVTKGFDRDVQRRGDDRVVLSGNGAFGHPSVLAGDDISFTMNVPQMWGALAVNLFAEDIESMTKGAQLHFIYSGNDFWCVLEIGENNSRSSEQLRNLSGKSIEIRLVFAESNLQVYANGMALMSAGIDDSVHKGLGLVFSPSGMWGNPTREVEVSGFSVRTRPDFIMPPAINATAKMQALTVPRFRRNSPATHVLLAPNGDMLRGRIEAADAQTIRFQSGTEMLDVPKERVSAAIWLSPPKELPPPDAANSAGATAPAAPAAPPVTANVPVVAELTKSLASHWLILQDGSRLAVKVDKFEKDGLVAWSPGLGTVHVPGHLLSVLRFTAPAANAAMVAYQNWQTEYAPEPVLPESGGQSDPLLNKPAPDFTLPLLGDAPLFRLQDCKGKIVVLDFWATWCGPCVASMPEQLKAMEQFDPSKVVFVAVNQGEPAAVVKRFVDARGWKMTVAMDAQQDVGRKYGVEGIPHCVVINADGTIIWSATGFAPGQSEKMAAAIRKSMGP